MVARKTANFLVKTGNTLVEQVWFKYQSCQLKLKFGTWPNLNMQNSISDVHLFRFPPEMRFLGRFGPKI